MAKSSDLPQRLDRRALLQKLQAGCNDFVAWLEATENGIGIAYGLS
jgi:hypothetical protein